jgi:hypothetical protein
MTEIEKKIEDWCIDNQNIENKNNSLTFYCTQIKIARQLKIDEFLDRYGYILEKYGFSIKKSERMCLEIKIEKLKTFIKDIEDNSIKLGKEYNYLEIERLANLPYGSFNSSELKTLINNSNIKIKQLGTENFNKDKEKFIATLKNIRSNKEMKNKSYTKSELEKLSGIKKGYITKSVQLKALIHDFGIIIKETTSNLTSNLLQCLEIAKKMKVSFSDVTSFIEFAQDILKVNIHTPDKYTENYIIDNYEMFNKTISKTEEKKIIESTFVNLTIIEEFSLSEISFWELKLHILIKHNLYISEEIIESVLHDSGIDTKEIYSDNMKKRFKYAELLIEAGIIDIDFVDSLPQINNSIDGNIILLNKINNNKSFIDLWKEYCHYIINEEIFGHVKNGNIKTSGSLDELLELHPEYKDSFFLSEDFLKDFIKLGYKGVAALAYTAMNKSKNDKEKRVLSKKFHSTNARCSGFFMYLCKKEVGLSHPKFITIFGETLINKIIEKLSAKHNLHMVLLEAKKNQQIKKKDSDYLSSKMAIKQLNYLYFACSYTIDPWSPTKEDFENYYNSAQLYANPNGTMNHARFVEILFLALDNKNAIKQKEDINIIDKYGQRITDLKLSRETLDNYKTLIDDSTRILNERILLKEISIGSANQDIKAYCTLFSFLNLINKKLSRKEMIETLNPTIKTEYDFKTYYLEKYSVDSFWKAGSILFLLFDETEDKEYKGACNTSWFSRSKKHNKRKLVRSGMNDLIYETLQKIALHSPAKSDVYPFLKYSESKELVDTSWWKHDTSPIPAVALWLATKLPRRGLHILNLDVENFLIYNETQELNGKTKRELAGFLFNTDKNKDFVKKNRDFIPSRLLRRIFTESELSMIENYVDYIKKVYYFVGKVKYPSGGDYKDFRPLFPANNYKEAMPKRHLDAYFNKTLLLTQFKVREMAINNEINKYFNEDEREEAIEKYKDCTLLFRRKNGKKLPQSLEEMNFINYSDSLYFSYFTSKDGLHNLRGTGATYLLMTVGFSIEDITFVTGHTDDKVLQNVYLNIKEHQLLNILNNSMVDLGLITEKLKEPTLSPKSSGENFINKVVLRAIELENDDSNIVLQKLINNGYISQKVPIISDNKKIYGDIGEIIVNNGLEIASKFHPIGNWESLSYGICTMKNKCPQGTAGICSKCPHLIFNLLNIEGILFKINEITLILSNIQILVSESFKKGNNQARQELKKEHDAVFEEWIGWMNIITLLEEEYLKNESESKNKSLVVSSCVAFTYCDLKRLQVEIINHANKLNIKNNNTERAKIEISNKLLMTAVKNNDTKTSKKLITEGINWFINIYDKSSLGDKIKLVDVFMNENIENGLRKIDLKKESSNNFDDKKLISSI